MWKNYMYNRKHCRIFKVDSLRSEIKSIAYKQGKYLRYSEEKHLEEAEVNIDTILIVVYIHYIELNINATSDVSGCTLHFTNILFYTKVGKMYQAK